MGRLVKRERMKKLIRLKNGNDKCPHCGTIFENNTVDMDPMAVLYRKKLKQRRSRAAKRGWKKRRALEGWTPVKFAFNHRGARESLSE